MKEKYNTRQLRNTTVRQLMLDDYLKQVAAGFLYSCNNTANFFSDQGIISPKNNKYLEERIITEDPKGILNQTNKILGYNSEKR
jgi:hypothetical protein